MRERSLDEFESIFERASIPVLDIREVALARVSMVLAGDPLDAPVLEMLAYLQTRFRCEVHVHRPDSLDSTEAARLPGEHGLEAAPEPFRSTAELVGLVGISRSQLVLLPEPEAESARVVDLDMLVQGTAPPILIIRRPFDEPAAVFRRILHSLTGNFQQTRNFAYSFTLAEDDGRLMLLHVIRDHEVHDVREALQVSPEIADASGEALVEKLAQRGERYLKAVVAASREQPFDVGYCLAVGDIIATVRDELDRGNYGLLVVGSHAEGHSCITTDDYQLMHQVREIPVLAL